MAFEKVCRLTELQVDGPGHEAMVAGRVIALFRAGQQIYAVDGDVRASRRTHCPRPPGCELRNLPLARLAI